MNSVLLVGDSVSKAIRFFPFMVASHCNISILLVSTTYPSLYFLSLYLYFLSSAYLDLHLLSSENRGTCSALFTSMLLTTSCYWPFKGWWLQPWTLHKTGGDIKHAYNQHIEKWHNFSHLLGFWICKKYKKHKHRFYVHNSPKPQLTCNPDLTYYRLEAHFPTKQGRVWYRSHWKLEVPGFLYGKKQ